jgi:hypothetical protein
MTRYAKWPETSHDTQYPARGITEHDIYRIAQSYGMYSRAIAQQIGRTLIGAAPHQ